MSCLFCLKNNNKGKAGSDFASVPCHPAEAFCVAPLAGITTFNFYPFQRLGCYHSFPLLVANQDLAKKEILHINQKQSVS